MFFQLLILFSCTATPSFFVATGTQGKNLMRLDIVLVEIGKNSTLQLL